MAKFKVIWPTKKKLIVEKSDCDTVEEFINAYFGSAGVIGDTKVTKVGEEKEEKKEEKKSKPVKNASEK